LQVTDIDANLKKFESLGGAAAVTYPFGISADAGTKDAHPDAAIEVAAEVSGVGAAVDGQGLECKTGFYKLPPVPLPPYYWSCLKE